MVFFERPEAFFLLLAFLPAVLAGTLWERRKQKKAIDELSLFDPKILRKVLTKSAIALSILALLSASLAQLKVVGAVTEVEVGGKMVLCLDNTESMDARKTFDDPSRLERSKRFALRTLGDFHFVQVGICALGEAAHFLVPPSQMTEDKKILGTVIEDFLMSGAYLEEGTDIVGSLRDIAEAILEEYPDSENLPPVVILTDGEATVVRDSVEEDIAYLKESGIPFALVGVGETEGATIPRFNADGRPTGYYATYQRERYVSYLKEEYLRDFAQRIGGQYFSENEPGKLADFVRSHLPEIHQSKEERGAKNISHFLIIPLLLLVGIFTKKYIL